MPGGFPGAEQSGQRATPLDTGAGKEPAMEGLTITILLILLFFGVLLSWMSRQGNAVRERLTGVFPLAPEKAVKIAVEAGLTPRERLLRKHVHVLPTVEGMKFAIACRAGVMSFEISESAGTPGSRVLAHAEDLAVIRLPEIGGLGAPSTNVLHSKVSLPRNPAKLLRRRERVFRALERAVRCEGRDAAGGAGLLRRATARGIGHR